jgi:hypothetical protein
MEELLEHFRFWNKAWDDYQNGDLKNNVKPTSKEVFLAALNKRYTVLKFKEL